MISKKMKLKAYNIVWKVLFFLTLGIIFCFLGFWFRFQEYFTTLTDRGLKLKKGVINQLGSQRPF